MEGVEMFSYRVVFKDQPWESPMDGMRFKACRHGDTQLRMVEYTPEMEPHWCEKGHVGCVLEGQFEIEFPRGKALFHPGDGVFIPAGPEHRHMGKALSAVVRVVFVEQL